MIRSQRFKRIKKDYQLKNLQNPFRREKKPKGRGFVKFIIVGLFLLLCFILWTTFASPWVNLNKIEISGLTRFTNSELEKIVWSQTQQTRFFVLKQSNIFLFDEESLVKNILASYNFAGLEVLKKLPTTIELKVSERPFSFIFKEGTNFYYASNDGSVIKEVNVSEDDKKKYLILENNASSLINEKNRLVLQENYLNFILALGQELNLHQDLPVERFIIDQEFNTVKVKFLNGPLVYFNVKNGVSEQVNRLVLVKKEKIKDNFSKVNYIDLRYGERIFIN